MTGKISSEKEIEAINLYTTSPLKKEDVFTFTVTLCDNEIDRDFECFSKDTLISLKELFAGKTGISDHSMRSKDQRARIFNTFLEEGNQKTASGESYLALKAQAYMLRTDETASLIAEIEGGIKKEVSISCSVNKATCSICGADMKKHSCKHIKGRYYNSELCYAILSEPTDAYEWSFVAVPAQRKAGVTKSYTYKEENNLHNTDEILKSLSPEKAITEAEIDSLKAHIASLTELAEEARIYKSTLLTEIERLALLAMPKVSFKAFIASCEGMRVKELRELRDGLDSQVREKMPATLQLRASAKQANTENNTEFKI